MTHFIKNILILFLIPALALACSTEVLLRHIPNNYIFKKGYLEDNSGKIETLILGNSHAYYGVNPIYLSGNSFNASYVSQTLSFDFEVLKKYNSNWQSLKTIVIPVSYFSLYNRLENSVESWRVCNYVIYYGMDVSNKITDYSEILSNKPIVNATRLTDYYLFNTLKPLCSYEGWGKDYSYSRKGDLYKTGIHAAKKHTYKDTIPDVGNVNILKAIIQYAKERSVKVVLFTPPAFHTYTSNLNAAQLRQTINTATDLEKQYDNVFYANLLLDSSFVERDFYDADHLDEFGAEKLTRKIDSIIATYH